MQTSKINLLIVDDNIEFCNIVNAYMEVQDDINVIGEANDGMAALEYIRKNRPDVVLLDMIMPRLDGIGVLEALSTMDLEPVPKIIMLSAIGHDSLTQKAISLGADYYIVKPFDFSVLIARIRQMFQNGITSNEVKRNAKPTVEDKIKKEPSTLEEQITNLICQIGIPAHISGYKYVREAISVYMKHDGIISLTKDLYPQIAERYNTTPSRVERAIRHAIEVAWERDKTRSSEEIINMITAGSKAKPTNGEFIALLADKLRLRNRVL